MRSALIAAILGGGTSVLAQGQVDPAIHKLCIEAKDYAGCVRAMKGDSSTSGNRVINSQGADIAEGNQCPAGFAYIGGGNCQEVRCQYPSSDLGHDQIVAGKPGWGCKYNWLRGAGELRLGAVGRASANKQCPMFEPSPGYNSSCTEAIHTGRMVGTGLVSEPRMGIFYITAVQDSEIAAKCDIGIEDKILTLNGQVYDEALLKAKGFPSKGDSFTYELEKPSGRKTSCTITAFEFTLDKKSLEDLQKKANYKPK